MADNTTLPGTGDVIASDDLTTLNGGVVAGVKAQRMKVGFGVDGTLRDVDATNGLPVVGAFFQTTQPVSGAFFQTTQPVSNAGTFAVQATATPIAITKGTQGATGFTTQNLKDAGRNLVCYYMLIPVLASATDTLQSLTGTKGGVTVAATTTPAVVTTAKNLRVSSITATYISTATSGYAVVRVRAQPAGVATITSPIVATFAVGNSSPTLANATDCVMEDFPDGSEFAAGVGIGISVQGFVGVTATAVGYVMVSINGYEY